MNRISPILAIALLAWSSSALAQRDIHLTSMSLDGVTVVDYAVPIERAAASPRWDSGKGDPPLSQVRAIQIANAELKRRLPATQGLQLQSIILNRVSDGPYGNLWYYSLDYRPLAGSPPKPAWITHIIVLLDGSIVDAIIHAP